MLEILDKPALRRLTGAAHVTRQHAWLAARGIPHEVDGRRIILLDEHVKAWLEKRPMEPRTVEPNWAALGA